MDKPNNTPPPWSEAPPWAMWLAQDEDGSWFYYKSEPEINREDSSWTDRDIDHCLLVSWSNPNPNFWDTLQKRPENE